MKILLRLITFFVIFMAGQVIASGRSSVSGGAFNSVGRSVSHNESLNSVVPFRTLPPTRPKIAATTVKFRTRLGENPNLASEREAQKKRDEQRRRITQAWHKNNLAGRANTALTQAASSIPANPQFRVNADKAIAPKAEDLVQAQPGSAAAQLILPLPKDVAKQVQTPAQPRRKNVTPLIGGVPDAMVAVNRTAPSKKEVKYYADQRRHASSININNIQARTQRLNRHNKALSFALSKHLRKHSAKPPKEQFYQAIMDQKIRLLNILKFTVDINDVDNEGNTFLHYALKHEKDNVALWLLAQSNILINKPNAVGFTPLHEICNKDNKELFESIIKIPGLAIIAYAKIGGYHNILKTPRMYAVENAQLGVPKQNAHYMIQKLDELFANRKERFQEKTQKNKWASAQERDAMRKVIDDYEATIEVADGCNC